MGHLAMTWAYVVDGVVSKIDRNPPHTLQFQRDGVPVKASWDSMTPAERQSAGWYPVKATRQSIDRGTQDLVRGAYIIRADHVEEPYVAQNKTLAAAKRHAHTEIEQWREQRVHDPLTVSSVTFAMDEEHKAWVAAMIGAHANADIRGVAFPALFREWDTVDDEPGDYRSLNAKNAKLLAEAMFQRDKGINDAFDTAVKTGKAATDVAGVRAAVTAFKTSWPAP